MYRPSLPIASVNVVLIAILTGGALYAIIATMILIDADWIKGQMSGKRGEQTALAKAMGIDKDKMSKILKGRRQVQLKEMEGALRFFGFSEVVIDQEFRAIWTQLDEDKRQIVRSLAKQLFDSDRKTPPNTSETE